MEQEKVILQEEILDDKDNLITNGKHMLSGIGHCTIYEEWSHNELDCDLFIIDGITYGACIDPDDGYRSYGILQKVENHKCQFTFPEQEVNVINKKIVAQGQEDWWDIEDKTILIMTNANNGKDILIIGTDYTEDYYPMAIKKYYPQNLSINQDR